MWKTTDRLRHLRNIGNIELPEPDRGDAVQYILDGQQRITSLYAVRKGAITTREGQTIDYKDIAIDLTVDPSDEDKIVFEQKIDGHECISVFKLLNSNPQELHDDHGIKFLNRISQYQSRLEGYEFSTVVIDRYPVDVACEVFTRINTGGQDLTLFEIMVAKTFDEERDFDLAKRYSELVSTDSDGKDLQSAGYDGLPPETVLQCVAAHVSGSIDRRDVLGIDRSSFIDSWRKTIDGLFAAIDYLRTHLRIDVSRILPYNALLIPICWFFIRQEGRNISREQDALLRQYFYWASINGRFRSAAGTKVADDLKKMKRILEGKQPRYNEQEMRVRRRDIIWRQFTTGDAFCKAIICLLSAKGPKRLNTDARVILDNSWLKTAASKNYHHFFPRAFLNRRGYDSGQANLLMNIVLVDDYLNKRIIRDRPPSEYIAEFHNENPDLNAMLRTHYIGNPEDMGISTDDYERFVDKRARKIARALNKILDPKLS